MLVEEYRVSRSEIALATTYTATAVRTILGSLVASIVGFVAQSQRFIDVKIFQDIIVLAVGVFLFMAMLYYLWVLSNFAQMLARAYYELRVLRPIANELTADDRFLNWDRFDHDLNRTWVRSRSVIGVLAFLVIVVFHVVYLWMFAIDYQAQSFSALNDSLIPMVAGLNLVADIGALFFMVTLDRQGGKAFGGDRLRLDGSG